MGPLNTVVDNVGALEVKRLRTIDIDGCSIGFLASCAMCIAFLRWCVKLKIVQLLKTCLRIPAFFSIPSAALSLAITGHKNVSFE